MTRLLLISIISLTIIGCSNRTDIQGYWRLNLDEENEIGFFPYELSFKQETMLMVDAYNFKQTSRYSVFGDSIYMNFENGVKASYSFSSLNDSTIEFAGRIYSRTSEYYFSETQPYELLGWTSNHEYNPLGNTIIVHLIKVGESTNVILNDVTTDLEYLPEFLMWENDEYVAHSQKPKICLYIGKGIKLMDLVDVYCWIKYSGYQKVELVTSNLFFEKFYSIQDQVDVEDKVFLKFQEDNRLPLLPPQIEYNNDVIDVFISSKTDFTFDEHIDTITYRYNFSTQLDINRYLEFTKRLNQTEKKKPKRLTAPYQIH